MTLDEALRDIESLEFAARVNIASDLRTFLRVAGDQESVRTVLSGITSEENQQRVLLETLRLSRLQVDLRYENPWDSALAVLLWVLSLKALPLARVAAEAAVQAPQCWWALRVAEGILRGSLPRSTQTSRRDDEVIPWALPLNLKNINAGENILRTALVRRVSFLVDIHLYVVASAELPYDLPATASWPLEKPDYVVDFTSQDSATPRAERIAL